jgi:hypothetical protein
MADSVPGDEREPFQQKVADPVDAHFVEARLSDFWKASVDNIDTTKQDAKS